LIIGYLIFFYIYTHRYIISLFFLVATPPKRVEIILKYIHNIGMDEVQTSRKFWPGQNSPTEYFYLLLSELREFLLSILLPSVMRCLIYYGLFVASGRDVPILNPYRFLASHYISVFEVFAYYIIQNLL